MTLQPNAPSTFLLGLLLFLRRLDEGRHQIEIWEASGCFVSTKLFIPRSFPSDAFLLFFDLNIPKVTAETFNNIDACTDSWKKLESFHFSSLFEMPFPIVHPTRSSLSVVEQRFDGNRPIKDFVLLSRDFCRRYVRQYAIFACLSLSTDEKCEIQLNFQSKSDTAKRPMMSVSAANGIQSGVRYSFNNRLHCLSEIDVHKFS